MQILTQNFKRNPNELVSSMYSGVAQGNRTVTTIVKPSLDRNRMETTRVYGPAIPRGQGGRIGVLVLGGMETTLDEVQDILEAHRQQKFVPQRNNSEIAQMCRMVADKRNELIMAARRKVKGNPSEAPKKRVGLFLPKGFKYVRTSEPGLKVAVRA
jgi:hypothetical protein